MYRSTATIGYNVYSSVDELRGTTSFDQEAYKGMYEPVLIERKHEYTYPSSISPVIQTTTRIWQRGKLSPLPGCSAVVISSDSYLSNDFRGYGLGNFFHKERLDLARDYNSAVMMCTVSVDNHVEKNLLTKNGWKMVHSFHNKHTDHGVEMWVKDL